MIEERIVGSIDTVQDLKKVRWLGPPILIVLVLLGIAIDASNGVLTTDGAMVGIIFGTPIASSIVEYSRNVRGKRLLGLELDENYNRGPLGIWFVVLFTEIMMCGILGSILSLLVGITLAIVSGIVTSVVGIPSFGADALGITSMFLSGLFLTFIMSDLSNNEGENTQQSVTVERDRDKDSQSTQTAADVDQIETSNSDKELIDEIRNDIDVLEADLVHDNLNRSRKCLERADLNLAAVEDTSIPEDLITKKTELRIRLLNAEAESYLQAATNAVEDGHVELAKRTVEDLRNTATELDGLENEDAKQWHASIKALESDLSAVERELEHRTAIESKLTDAETALDEADLEVAEATLDSVDAQLEDLEQNNSDLAAELRSEYATLRSRFETARTSKFDRSLVGLLGSLGSARSQIEDLIADNQGEQAIERVERALDIHDEAEQLNAEHDLGRGDRLEEIQGRLKQLEKEAASILAVEDKKQAQSRYKELWSGSKRDRSTAESLLDAGEYKAARNATNSGLENCQEMREIQETYSLEPVDTASLQTDLKTLAERIEVIEETLETVDEHQNSAERAIKYRDYETASSAVSELEYSIEVLEKHNADQSTIDRLQGKVADLEAEIEAVISARERVNKSDSDLYHTKQTNGRTKEFKSQLTVVKEAIDKDDAEAAEAALEEANSTLERLKQNNSADTAELRSEINTLSDRLETLQANKADQQLIDILESLKPVVSHGEDLIANKQFEQVRNHVEEAFERYHKAEKLNEEHDLRRRNCLEEIRVELIQLENETEDGIQAESQHEGLWADAQRDRSTAESLLDAGEYKSAHDSVNSGLENCQEARKIQETYDVEAVDIASKQAELETLAERIEAIQELLETADEHQQTAESAINSNDYETARTAVSNLDYNIGLLEKHDVDQSTVDRLQGTVADLEAEIKSNQVDSTVIGYLGSAASAQAAVEELLEEGNIERAVQRLESTAESLAEAERLNSDHSLERGDAIAERQQAIDTLLEEAANKPEEEVRKQVEMAETEIESGIEARNADDIAAAVEAFETAVETYDVAFTNATEYDLDLQWEVEQRASMAVEYLTITEDRLDERKRTVNDALGQTLDAVDSTVIRAEQHMEVGDTVSARESVEEAVTDLDDAIKLIETDLTTSALMERYGDLSERVATLASNLPDENKGEHRDSDLIDTLQLLTRKIGESPRPEFVHAYGEYPAEAYIDSFGSWSEALAVANLDPIDAHARERRQYSRKEVLDAIIELAGELGHLPSRTEMNARGEMSSTTVGNRFTDWDTALQFAEDVRGEPSVETGLDGDKKGTTPVDSGVETTSQTSEEVDEKSPAEDDILSEIEDELGDW